jgi:hypothetical protein
LEDLNPKHLDCGELIDAETGWLLRPATADEARRSPRAQQHEGTSQGVIGTTCVGEPVLARVRLPEDTPSADFRLAFAIKMKFERAMLRLLRTTKRDRDHGA